MEATPNHVRIKTKKGNIFTFSRDEIESIMAPEALRPAIASDDREVLIAASISGIIPGAGQAFNYQYEKALAFLGAWSTGIYFAVTAFEPIPDGNGVFIPHDNTSRFALGALLTYGSSLMSIVDAAIVRAQINQRKEQRRKQLNIGFLKEPNSFGLTLAVIF